MPRAPAGARCGCSPGLFGGYRSRNVRGGAKGTRRGGRGGVMQFTVERQKGGWRLPIAHNGHTLVVGVTELEQDRRGIRGTVTVFLGDALLQRDRVNLTSATSRKRLVTGLAQ